MRRERVSRVARSLVPVFAIGCWHSQAGPPAATARAGVEPEQAPIAGDAGVANPSPDAGTGSNDVAAALGAATLPQLTAARGGSLGIPSPGTPAGLTANVDAQLFADSATANAFAQLGGLPIGRRVTVDIFAESVSQDLPRFLLSDNMVKTDMFNTTLSSAGARIRIHLHDVLLVSRLQSPECQRAWAEFPKHSRSVSELIADVRGSNDPKAEAVQRDCRLDDIKAVLGWTLTLGAHVLRRTSSEPGGAASNGGAAEVIGQREGQHYAGYLGVSGVVLTHADDRAGSSIAQFPTFSIARLTAGAEYRGDDDQRGGLVPRAGIYGVASHAWWHDPYTFGTIEPRVQSTELEAGVYLGGKFSDKFSGLLALRVLRAFGPKQDSAFILSFIPSAGSTGRTPVPPTVQPAPGAEP